MFSSYELFKSQYELTGKLINQGRSAKVYSCQSYYDKSFWAVRIERLAAKDQLLELQRQVSLYSSVDFHQNLVQIKACFAT